MRADALFVASGLLSEVTPTGEALEALRLFTRGFLLAGGRLTLAEYSALSPEARLIVEGEAALIEEARAESHATALLEAIQGRVAGQSRDAGDAIADLLIGGTK